MKRLFPLVFLLHGLLLAAAKDGGSNSVKAALTVVTVFRTGAEMNHRAKAEIAKGNSELIISNVSNTIEASSIQVTSNSNVTIMGVEFSADHLQNEVKSPAVMVLQDSLESITYNLEKLKTSIDINRELATVLKANKEIKGTQSGLSVAELIKLMDYYKTKSQELQTELATLQMKERKLNELANRLTAQIEEEQKKNTGSTGKLVLQLNCAVAGNYDFRISYITQHAYWSPFYDLRATDVSSPLKVVYRASIFQTTGIDWKQVKLSLSTSTPGQARNAPVFKTWFLSYINPLNYYQQSMLTRNTIQSMDTASGPLAEVVVTGYGTNKIKIRGSNTISSGEAPLYIVNGNEMSASDYSKISNDAIKNLQVLKDDAATAIYGARAANGAVIITLKDGLDDYITVSDKELNVLFDIDLPYDVPTNGKAQTAILKEYEVPAIYKFYAVPKLDKDVFLLAEIPDWEALNLLPGEANINLEGTYIGKSFIDPSNTQDTLNLTMGRDKRVVVQKEKLVDFSSIKFLGANKKQTFAYEITVKNNKKDAISMLLKDQYPVSQDKDVNVDLLESSGAANNTDTGVLTWKLQLAPGEIKKIRLSYSVKYPKEKSLNLH